MPMEGNTMADRVARKLPLRHPAEMPTFILMVVLNFLILGVLIDFLSSIALIPPALRGTNWEATWRAVAGAIILGPTLFRLREYSCDRNGAALESKGELGLVLLTARRYAADNVQVSELVDQGRHLGGFWVGISQWPRSHPNPQEVA
jgi:Zn-dependent protease with chaperone function